MPDKQQLILEVARMVREFLLQQNAYHEVDTYCSLEKSHMIMKTIKHYYMLAQNALEQGVRIKSLLEMKAKDRISEAKFDKDYKKVLESVQKDMDGEFNKLKI